MVYFLSLFLSAIVGFVLGLFVAWWKLEEETDRLRRSLSYWRTRSGMSYKTFDPDLYDE